jgi:Ser/Thr protein kinase RdoA (MazF antagonist)
LEGSRRGDFDVSPTDIPEGIRSWLAAQGWGLAEVEPVSGGTNNRVFRIGLGAESRLLKISAHKADDPRDRFSAEQEFYDFLEAGRVNSAPRRFGFEPSHRAAVYEWIDGRRVGAEVGEKELDAALEFVAKVQQSVPPNADRIASEACFALSDHLALIDRRIDALRSRLRARQVVGSFVDDELMPAWRKTQKELAGRPAADFAASSGRRLFSPGDFGFHNALRKADGQLFFFDFEYCGWDDPAKTVADIFLQPESPVALGYWNSFCEAFGERLKLGDSFADRADALRPLFAVKWACILLNALIKNPAAGSDQETLQLAKARSVLARYAGESGGAL